MDVQRTGASRRSSGILLNASPAGQSRVLCEALSNLTTATRAVSANIRHVNCSLERILKDEEELDELKRMLNSLKAQ